jgi:hypothetical protein
MWSVTKIEKPTGYGPGIPEISPDSVPLGSHSTETLI